MSDPSWTRFFLFTPIFGLNNHTFLPLVLWEMVNLNDLSHDRMIVWQVKMHAAVFTAARFLQTYRRLTCWANYRASCGCPEGAKWFMLRSNVVTLRSIKGL